MKKCPDLYIRCCKKASTEEKALIDQCLSFLKLEVECVEGAQEDSVLGEDEKESSFPALQIFDKVLSKAISDPSSPVGQAHPSSSSLALVPTGPVASKADDQKPNGRTRPNVSQSGLAQNEEEELKRWMLEPMADSPKRKRKQKKQGKKAKTESSEGASDEEASIEKKPKSKKKGAVAKAKAKTKPKVKKGAVPKPKLKPKAGPNPLQRPSGRKTTWKHRMTSSAYHKARAAARRKGEDEETAIRFAQEALRDMAKRIEDGELVEPST